MLSVRNGARRRRVLQGGVRGGGGVPHRGPLRRGGGAAVGGGAEFWLSDESPEHGNFSPETLGGGTARMILTVPDPDAAFARALAAGAREVVAVKEDYGWRLGGRSIRSATTGRSAVRSLLTPEPAVDAIRATAGRIIDTGPGPAGRRARVRRATPLPPERCDRPGRGCGSHALGGPRSSMGSGCGATP